MKRFQWTAIAAAAALLTSTVAQAAFLASEKEVKRQARMEWLQMKRHLPLEPDARITNYVQCVANRVIAELPPEQRDAFDWEVVVFDEDTVNAMVDPNGKISVFNGLLRVADTQDALAAVIGHEITHATLGHTMDRMKRAARQDVWSMIGAAATGVAGPRLSAHRARTAVLSRARDRVGRRGARAHVQGGFRPAGRPSTSGKA